MSVAAPEIPWRRFLVVARLADTGILPNIVVRGAGIPGIPKLDRPEWVYRCGEKINAALFPQVRESAALAESHAGYEAGFACGLIHAGLQTFSEALSRMKPRPKLRTHSEEELKARLEELFGEHGHWFLEISKGNGEEFLKSVEEYEAGLSVREHSNYCQGQADAMKMVAGDNHRTDATDIHLFMLLFWRVVDRLESVDHLYRLLVTAFGRNRIGPDPKRIAQICQRVGKRYRMRGRPRKQPLGHGRLRYLLS